jgi:hypothetical protein
VWEAHSSSAIRSAPDIWWKMKVNCCIGMILPVFHLQKQINQFYTFPYYLLQKVQKIYKVFNPPVKQQFHQTSTKKIYFSKKNLIDYKSSILSISLNFPLDPLIAQAILLFRVLEFGLPYPVSEIG